jgi:hypothetical protein
LIPEDSRRFVCCAVVAGFGKGRLSADVGPDDFARLREKPAESGGRTAGARTFKL